MADASYAVSNFLGGEVSQFASGRFDKPDYRISLNTCLNAFAVEIGPWVRRPGTMNAGHTRGGAKGRVIKFDFQQSVPYTLEFTDGFLRFRNGETLVITNDAQAVSSVSTANPAVVQTGAAHGWTTGNTVIFSSPGPAPLLENRQFVATVVDTTHVSLADALTGATIDGSTLGTITTTGTTISRVQELATAYASGSWANIRPVQAETTDLLLAGNVAPQALTVAIQPTAITDATFAINPAVFIDGPYLDGVTGALATPSAVTGNVTLTLSFAAYIATAAYKKGDFVSVSGVSYQSLIDGNAGNTPASSPTFWKVVSPGLAVGPNGFVATDIGRLIRVNNPTSGWTWGKILGLTNAGIINPALPGSTNFGSVAYVGGGVNSIFDGQISKSLGGSAVSTFTAGVSGLYNLQYFAGKNYSGASAQVVTGALVYPPVDSGFAGSVSTGVSAVSTLTLQLRGGSAAPTGFGQGTLLGTTTGVVPNTLQSYFVPSNSGASFNFVWVEFYFQASGAAAFQLNFGIAQIQFFGTGAAPGTAVTLAILGPPLTDTTASAYLVGAYSDTTGWPTTGCYHEGRIWLGGAIDNRFDASVSNGIKGGTVNFAPTDATGLVTGASAISYTLNADGVNPILSMQPDLQGIIVFTQECEYLLQAPTTGPLTATNIAGRRVTSHGSANIQPCRTEHTTIFVQRFAQKLLEYFPDVFSGKFSAPNLADKAQHLTRNKVAELAYTSAMTPIVWGRDLVGGLFGVTYKRDSLASSQPPSFYGWHRHTLGSGRIVESICAGPSTGGNLDTLTMVTNDPVTNIRHVELLTDTLDELSPLTAAWFLDDSVAPSSTSSTNAPVIAGDVITDSNGNLLSDSNGNPLLGSGNVVGPYGGLTVNGLWHLNGKTVQIWAGGLDCGDRGAGTTGFADFIVTNGSILVPYGDGISAGCGKGLFTAAFVAAMKTPIAVGFTYTSQGKLLPQIVQADSGARNGPAFGKLRRAHRYAVKLVNSLGLSFGTSFSKMFPANFRQENQQPLAPLTTFSGVHQDTLNDGETFEQSICWQVTRPYPANVVAIGGNIQTQDQ